MFVRLPIIFTYLQVNSASCFQKLELSLGGVESAPLDAELARISALTTLATTGANAQPANSGFAVTAFFLKRAALLTVGYVSLS